MIDQFARLTLSEKAAISIEKTEENYILDLASQPSDPGGDGILAVTGTNNSIRLHSRQNLALKGKITGHQGVVSSVKFGTREPALVYSSSLDATVRCWDTRDKNNQVHKYEGQGDERGMFLSLSVSCDDRTVCCGTEGIDGDTWIMFWDRRKPGIPIRRFTECHNDDITQVQFHPSEVHKMASGSTDGLINIYDLRETDEDDAIEMTLNTESSVGKLGWKGPGGDNLYCITHLETFHIWDSEGDLLAEHKNLKENFKELDYLVDCFEDGSSNFFLLAGSHNGDMQVLSLGDAKSTKCSTVGSLCKGHTDTVRSLSYSSSGCSLVTGGEDGMLCLWTPNNNGREPVTSHSKDSMKVKDKKSRTKPYSKGAKT
ncbi:unnamed protein product [Owenia fusiformis]|uniref:WD repeat-containing protein 89 n=1 Tax=Owenia fusiformis TaxID=6347 RepID=A0A8J1Y9U2_OWEFU|nr:unnamed protein product [Owenia fusiformis]